MFSLADASNILNAPTFSDLACSLIEDAVIWPEAFLRASVFLKSFSSSPIRFRYVFCFIDVKMGVFLLCIQKVRLGELLQLWLFLF